MLDLIESRIEGEADLDLDRFRLRRIKFGQLLEAVGEVALISRKPQKSIWVANCFEEIDYPTDLGDLGELIIPEIGGFNEIRNSSK